MATALLDRDGVINENRDHYVTRWEDFRFLPRSIDAMTAFRDMGLRLAVITNQSAVGRGLLSQEGLDEIHGLMQSACAANDAVIDAVFACPHAPSDGCGCRKPQPGLLLQAMEQLDERPEACIAIGDSSADLGAAEAVGVPFVLVRTGHGERTLENLEPKQRARLEVARDLWGAIELVRAQFEPSRRVLTV